MSKNRPIPARLEDKFKAHMDAHNLDSLPDGAWFATLEAAAADFMRSHRLHGCENNATHQYLLAQRDKEQA